jgi:hypothetical protein
MVRGFTAGTLLVLAALMMPAFAAAHGAAHGELSAADQHRAADLAGIPVPTLERRVRAVTRKLGRQPGTAPPSARAAEVTDPGIVGRWSGVLPAPVLPIFSALLPNGKILMWDSVGDNAAETYPDHTFTRAAVYDPAANTSKRVDVQGANIFCAGFVQLANGNVFVAGGNADSALNGIRHTHTFDWRSETWSRGPDMQDGRWYPSVAALPNDEALIIGGGPTVAEVRTQSGGLRRLTGVVTPSSREYPFVQATTDGRALLFGPGRGMSLIDAVGLGALSPFGNRDAINRTYGGYAPYTIGKFLVAGGGSVTEDGLSAVPSRTATTVDTRTGTPVGTPTGSMAKRRRQHNLTILADGTVLATGGMSTNNGGGLVDLANAVYAAERWDPATGAWTTLASASVARQYHSTALLLPDGRVLTGGGGICGVCQQVGYLRKDMEVFSPPYLFAKNGSGALAARPQITGAPATISYDGRFTVSSPTAGQIRKMALVRLGAPTHSEDQSQRYVPLTFSASGTTLNALTPSNANEAPAGHYMLFAVDAAGVPSMASIISVQRTPAGPRPPTNLALNRTATGSTACATTEAPAKAVNGSVSGGKPDKFCSNVASRELTVDLGSDRTVSTFVIKHAGAGGETTWLNTRAFHIDTRTTSGSWVTARTVTGNAASVTTDTVTPRLARYVRLVVTGGEQSDAAGAARIYELEVYAGASAPASPTFPVPVVAYSGLDATGRAQRFEVGRYTQTRGNLGIVGNDATRSIDIATGYRVTLCRTAGLSDCVTLAAGRHGTLPTGYDQTMSSLRVAPF